MKNSVRRAIDFSIIVVIMVFFALVIRIRYQDPLHMVSVSGTGMEIHEGEPEILSCGLNYSNQIITKGQVYQYDGQDCLILMPSTPYIHETHPIIYRIIKMQNWIALAVVIYFVSTRSRSLKERWKKVKKYFKEE